MIYIVQMSWTPEKNREYQREYYRAHRQEALEYAKKWRAENLGRVQDLARKRRAAKRVELGEKRRQWGKRNPDKVRAYNAANYAVNRQKRLRVNAAWKVANRNRVRHLGRKYYAAHLEQERARGRAYSAKNRKKTTERNRLWKKTKPEMVRMNKAKRRAAECMAMPRWLTSGHLNEIRLIYAEAARNELTVDHIIPLKGENVCGLHVPWNLRPLSSSENSRKGNRFVDVETSTRAA